jgi:hypothetical protein
VRGRQAVWSQPDIQELAARFVAATDEVWRLHHLKDPECQLFQTFMDEGIYRDRRGHSTRQGIFAIAPSGVLLADINTTRPGPMRDMLKRALVAWDKLPKAERFLPYDPETRRAQIKRGERRFPSDAVAMRVYVRDLPRKDVPADWRAKAWNIDHAWFRASELRSLLPANLKKKATKDWPQPLVDRIARLQLTDFVRGQTTPYAADALHAASLQTEVLKVKKGGIELRFSGKAQVNTGTWSDRPDGSTTRGIDVTLLGSATWDRRSDRFTTFELVAVGRRWGQTQFNFRQDDVDPAPIGWVLTLAPDGERVPPAALGAYGW